jgi:hypothetical protein
MRSDYVQVVHMAHEGFVARAASFGKFGASAPGQRHKLLRNRLHECHAWNRWHFWRLLKCLRPKRSHAPFDGW